jgi:hypothetical protein
MPLLDHHRAGRLQHDAVTCLQHMVVEVAAPRQPDPAAANRELAAQVVDPQRLAPECVKDRPLICIELRFHHQSPAPVMLSIIVVDQGLLQ